MTEVIATAATCAICVVTAVASTARSKELPFNATVESTDGSLSHPVASQECSLFPVSRFDHVRHHVGLRIPNWHRAVLLDEIRRRLFIATDPGDLKRKPAADSLAV